MADTNELKPCPFCGGEAYSSERTCDKDTPYNPNDRAYPVVRCSKCFTTVAGKDWTGVSTAIEVWNKRATATPPADAALSNSCQHDTNGDGDCGRKTCAKCYPQYQPKTADAALADTVYGVAQSFPAGSILRVELEQAAAALRARAVAQPQVFAPGSLDGKENTKTVRVELQPAPEGMAMVPDKKMDAGGPKVYQAYKKGWNDCCDAMLAAAKVKP